ncbi:hypothetical protein V6N12_063723 [Hibiscus sabdariffa]|uniref:C2 domain-containing protein n=1 Tax=Hibiscus sabdariffa TaxID=183260 RepID=A0ABR2FCK1_9ROSI
MKTVEIGAMTGMNPNPIGPAVLAEFEDVEFNDCSMVALTTGLEKTSLISCSSWNIVHIFANMLSCVDQAAASSLLTITYHFKDNKRVKKFLLPLVIRDFKSSDPYVVVKLGDQVAKTKVINSCLNPVWNEELTFSLTEPVGVLNLEVFDKDRFKADDKMGHAYLNLQPLVSAARLSHALRVSSGEMTLRKVVPDTDNCLSRESSISSINGAVVQSVWLRLCAVESGEIELKVRLIETHDGSSSCPSKGKHLSKLAQEVFFGNVLSANLGQAPARFDCLFLAIPSVMLACITNYPVRQFDVVVAGELIELSVLCLANADDI